MTLPPPTEREVEATVRDLFLRAGFYPAKTDSGMVTRRRTRGHLPSGFPDLTMLRALPDTGLCLAALIETKTATGRLRDSQTELHAQLRDLYGIEVHIIRDPQQAAALIAQAWRVVGALRSLT